MSAVSSVDLSTDGSTRTATELGYGICLAAIVGLGAWLRLSTIGRDSAWVDEVLSISYGSGSLLGVLQQLEPQHMPLYFLITSVMLQISDAEVWLRLPSAAFGIATLPLLCWIGVEAGRPRVGLAAAGIAAVSGFLVAYSQEIRMYSLVAFLGVLGTWGVMRVIRGAAGSRRRGWIVLVVASILSLYTSPFAAFMVAAHWAVLSPVVVRRGLPRLLEQGGITALPRSELGLLLACIALIAVAYIPGFLHMLPMVSGSAEVVQQPQRIYDDVGRMVSFTAGHFAGLVLDLRWPLMVVALGGAVVGVVFRVSRCPGLVAISVLSFALPIAALHVAKPHHFFNPRYLIFAQPHVLLMAAVAVVFAWDRLIGWTARWTKGAAGTIATVGPPVLGAVAILVATSQDPDCEILGRKGDWRGLARTLLDNLEPGDTVLIEPGWRSDALTYSLDRESEPGQLVRLDPRFAEVSAYRSFLRTGREERHPEQYGGPELELMGFDGIAELITVTRDEPGRIWVIASRRLRELRVLGYRPVYTMPGIHSYSGGRTPSEAMPVLALRGR